MVKTTVYIEESDLATLRRVAAESGRSQAELIREAIANVARSARPRRLRSAAIGQGSGGAVARHADEIARRELGRSRR